MRCGTERFESAELEPERRSFVTTAGFMVWRYGFQSRADLVSALLAPCARYRSSVAYGLRLTVRSHGLPTGSQVGIVRVGCTSPHWARSSGKLSS
jgi:hypothetical protein